jgi:hypothetical protein
MGLVESYQMGKNSLLQSMLCNDTSALRPIDSGTMGFIDDNETVSRREMTLDNIHQVMKGSYSALHTVYAFESDENALRSILQARVLLYKISAQNFES